MTKLITILLVCISLLVRSQTTYFITSKDSTRLYVQEFGSGDPVVILAGGPGLNAIYMEDVWKKLSSKYRCIVLDQRGTGKSIVAKVDSVSMSMSNYVNDLEALRHHLGVEKITLVGHSWGGMLIMEYTARHPLRVKKIIFLEPRWTYQQILSIFRRQYGRETA